MCYILENHSDDIADTRSRMTAVSSGIPDGLPLKPDPHAFENMLAASLDEIDVLKERYRRALEYMEWFKPAWAVLSEDEQFILSELFMRNDISKAEAVSNVGARLVLERSHVYRRKDRAVSHLALLLYGK